MAKIVLNYSEAALQGYTTPRAATKAGRRAIRWAKAPCNRGARAPGHIAQKMRLMEMK